MANPQGANPELVKPPYWDGIDIRDDANFRTREEEFVTLPSRVHHAAGFVLARSLEEVINGNYEQEDGAPEGVFNIPALGLQDGAITMFDTESLSLPLGHDFSVGIGEAQIRSQPAEPPIEDSDPVDYWRYNYMESGSENFGLERSVHPGSVHYARELKWGVVLPNRGGDKVITWHFSDFEAKDGAVSIKDYRVGTEAEPYRRLMNVGKAHVLPGREYEDCSIRRMKRIKDIQVVRVEGVDFEEAYKDTSLIRRLGRTVAPGVTRYFPS